MKRAREVSTGNAVRLALPAVLLVALVGMCFVGNTDVSANHPVLVEGNCLGAGVAQRTAVTPGTCGDYDGDGRIGTAEDTDEADRVFGTINAAVGNTVLDPAIQATTAALNGRVTIVASGNFPEVVTIAPNAITAASAVGNLQLEAAPGVEANIDAVVQGDPNNTPRQNAPGIIVDMPQNRKVTIRNITSRNWTDGIQVRNLSRVVIDNCRLDNNRDYGVRGQGFSRVFIYNSNITGTGYRRGSTGDSPSTVVPVDGDGVEFEDTSGGVIAQTSITGSFGQAISNESTLGAAGVRIFEVVFADNLGGAGGPFTRTAF